MGRQRVLSRRFFANSAMKAQQDFGLIASLSSNGERFLEREMQPQGSSVRAHDRILKVARTIADIGRQKDMVLKHTAEAIQYRTMDQ